VLGEPAVDVVFFLHVRTLDQKPLDVKKLYL
jgi:hypothetical protein